MQILPDDFPKSGYQPRLAAPPSAGRALSVLIAVCAVLWIWLMLPWWLVGEALKPQQVIRVVFSPYMLLPLVTALNIILLLYTTRPMWRGESPTLSEDMIRGFVLLLCLLFHLLTPPAAFLLAAVTNMD